MKPLLFNKPKTKSNNDNLSLLRVLVDTKYTRLDFGYQATSYYIRGGWITMHPNAYIIVKGTKEKLKLTKAVNIPIEPVKHNFLSSAESASFSLFFPAIPRETLTIDFIEEEDFTPTLFNFYEIQLDIKKAILVKNIY